MVEEKIENLHRFLSSVSKPLVVVSTLLSSDKEAVVRFLVKLNAPVYLEGISGIREEPRLQHLRITNVHHLWAFAAKCDYPIDGVLRIGGVPTFRPWRDLENKENSVALCSLSHLPFSGVSWGNAIHVNLSSFLDQSRIPKSIDEDMFHQWRKVDCHSQKLLDALIEEEPDAEPSVISALSMLIPEESIVYLGNSLPIREWDLAATYRSKKFEVFASRGQNGIDGQVSTFLGIAVPKRSNWGIFGDLTMLYDFAAPWILDQLADTVVNMVVMNNGGGKIFSRMYPYKEIQNCHHYGFEYFAKHWGLEYYKEISLCVTDIQSQNRFIELVPNEEATLRFWKKYDNFLNKMV